MSRSDSPGPPAVAHVGVTVDDLDQAIAWYRDVLRLRLISGPIEVSSRDARIGAQVLDVFAGPVRFRQAHMALAAGSALELFEFLEPKTEASEDFPFWRTGYSHLCLFDRDIEGVVERIAASDGRVRSSKIWEVIPGEPYRMCFCQDPSGNVLEIYSHSHEEVFGGREAYEARPSDRPDD